MTIGQQDFIDGVRKKSLHMGLFVATGHVHMADESEVIREECLIAVPPPSSAPAMYGWLPSLVRAFLRDRVRLNGCKAAWTADCDDRQTSQSHGGPNSPGLNRSGTDDEGYES